MSKLIINFTPTGIIPTKKINPSVPISPDEIIQDAKMAYNLGVQMIHLHVRDENGNNTSDPIIYGKVIKAIRKDCSGMIICVSLSGRVINTFEARSAVLDLEGDEKPDMGSLTLSSLNFMNDVSVNTPEMITMLLTKMNEKNIKPELEVFDIGMVNYSKHLIKKGLLKAPYYYNILCGNIFSAQADLSDISNMVNALPEGSIYSFAGLGMYQTRMNALGIVCANGVRVGLEDNIYYDYNKKILATNEMLIQRVIKIAHAYEREIATVDEVRKLLEMS